jgi:uncharacterized protein YwgA
MARIRDVIAFVCSEYPHKRELSKARLTKMVYLADWRAAIVRGAQITNIEWVFHHYGPYVEDVAEAARNDPAFEIIQTANMFGGQKEVIRLKEPTVKHPSITEDDAKDLRFVIEQTAPLYWNDFIELVYSTYPVISRPRYETLDLVALAKEYNAMDAKQVSEFAAT